MTIETKPSSRARWVRAAFATSCLAALACSAAPTDGASSSASGVTSTHPQVFTPIPMGTVGGRYPGESTPIYNNGPVMGGMTYIQRSSTALHGSRTTKRR